MQVHRIALVLVLGSALASPREARAEWYGAGMIAVDAGSWALTIGGAAGENPAVALTGVGVGIFGSPLFHLDRKNYGRLGASIGLRLGGPLIGFAIGKGGGSDDDHGGPAVLSGLGALGGAVIGLLVAQVIDIAVIARDDGDDAPAARMVSFGGRF